MATLAERVTARLETWKSQQQHTGPIKDYTDFIQQQNAVLTHVISFTMNHPLSPDENIDEFRGRALGSSAGINNLNELLSGSFHRELNKRIELEDIFNTETKAVKKEFAWKTFHRILSAAGIAAVILGASALANYFDLQISLFRFPS